MKYIKTYEKLLDIFKKSEKFPYPNDTDKQYWWCKISSTSLLILKYDRYFLDTDARKMYFIFKARFQNSGEERDEVCFSEATWQRIRSGKNENITIRPATIEEKEFFELHDNDESNIQISSRFHDNGNIRSKEYYKVNDTRLRHREDGPAVEGWFDTGEKAWEYYFINGEEHREDGPAHVSYDKDGSTKEYYWLNNRGYTREEWLEELKRIGSPHYKEQLMKYEVEKYNL